MAGTTDLERGHRQAEGTFWGCPKMEPLLLHIERSVLR